MQSDLFAQTTEQQVENLIQHADTYYWLGLAENGNVDAYKRGLEYLGLARGLAQDSSISSTDLTEKFLREITALEQDLREQLKNSKDRFYSFYPWKIFLK